MANYHQTTINGSVKGLPTHKDYDNYIDQYRFLKRSYLGGNEYKQGQYLTKYQYESDSEYFNRLDQSAVDNHCRSVCHIYNSFLYRQEPKRDFGWLENTPEMENFLKDCDLEGRSWDSFMREANLQSSIYGHCVVLVDRPEMQVGTRAEELAQDIRPYVTIYTPENVLDWKFIRQPNGHYELEMVKFLEEDDRMWEQSAEFYVRTWTKDKITLESFNTDQKQNLQLINERPNTLGKVPAVWVYANRGPIRGIGVSDINDIAQSQRFLHSLNSEAEQLIRLTNHPSLVKTNSVQASAGAGAIITMPEELDGNLKPFLLQPSGGNLQAILETMENTVKSIDRMAHLGAIRAVETRQMSGLAMQSEYMLLDAKLSEKAKNLELSEENIFRLFGLWQGQAWDGEIKYPTAFHIKDKNIDMEIIQKAAVAQRDSATATPKVKTMLDNKIVELLADDDEEIQEMQHPVTTPENRSQHIKEMIMEGLTDQQMLQLHPEINQADITTAKQELLNLNNASTSPTQTPTD
tara:strand:+ start:2601 stop:4160 length:1560 start_codon:yes stop_codon:yes gene_type:complete